MTINLPDYLNNTTPEGERNAALYKAAAYCLNDGEAPADAEAMLLPRALRDGLSESEAKQTIASAYRGIPRVSEYTPKRGSLGAVKVQKLPQLPLPTGSPQQQTIAFLEACFEAGEFVSVTTAARQEGDKWKPASAGKAVRLEVALDALRSGKTIGDIWGAYNPVAGAWVRINPTDGKGGKDENVTALRHLLVESDDINPVEQLAIIQRLKLPCSAIVHSGNKSIHAIVKVGAANRAEYNERQAFVYDLCNAEGLAVDNACKNPSRTARLPGVDRGAVA